MDVLACLHCARLLTPCQHNLHILLTCSFGSVYLVGMKPDRKHLGVRVQQWTIDAVRAVAREYQITYGEALEKIVATAKPILLEGPKEPTR